MTEITAILACAWCGKPFTATSKGRPKLYCSVRCRTAAGHYREDLPRWQARLAELELAAAGYRRNHVPVFIVNEIDALRRAIAAGPARS